MRIAHSLSPTMLGLAPHIHLARTSSSVILLDVRADRYLRLSDEQAYAIQRLRECDHHDRTAAALRSLIARGALVDGGRAPFTIDPPCATASVLEASYRAARRPAGLGRLLAWRWRARTRSFATLLRALRPMPPRRVPVTADIARELAGRFEHARQLVPLTRRCLPDACALVMLCRDRGIAARFVIGVRDRPFAAHAWVALDGVVLSDPLDVVRELVPIYVA